MAQAMMMGKGMPVNESKEMPQWLQWVKNEPATGGPRNRKRKGKGHLGSTHLQIINFIHIQKCHQVVSRVQSLESVFCAQFDNILCDNKNDSALEHMQNAGVTILQL